MHFCFELHFNINTAWIVRGELNCSVKEIVSSIWNFVFKDISINMNIFFPPEFRSVLKHSMELLAGSHCFKIKFLRMNHFSTRVYSFSPVYSTTYHLIFRFT